MEEQVRFHLLQAIFEAELATDFIEKVENPANRSGGIGEEHKIDISKCTKSEQYLDMVAHQIPIVDLYKLTDTCSYSQENEFCAIMIEIKN
jgi:hypothetical protein